MSTSYEQAQEGNLYGTSETYRLDTLDIRKQEEIGAGGCGNIYRGTITHSYGVHRLYSGSWNRSRGDFSPFHSYSYFSGDGSASSAVEETVPVAVKTIRSSEDEVLDLTREASSVRALQGMRNVAGVYGVTYNRDMESLCIAMELIDGPDLNSFLRSGETTAAACSWWKTKLEIFMELVIGVLVCHRRGVKGRMCWCTAGLFPDFGFSFRKRDVDYLRSLGGSPFWISPELTDAVDEIPSEVLENPYPCDVYSLGMVLVEMWIDGNIPEYMNSSLVMNKYLGGSPVDLAVPVGMEDMKSSIFDELMAVVDGCSAAERNDRISLEQCLVHVRKAYSQLCCCMGLGWSLKENELATSGGYRDMVAIIQERFPGVPDAILQQPARNMMVDSRGTLLVDLFCELDFEKVVKFIIDSGDWDFNPMIEATRLSRICVKHGSPRVLKLLGERWRDTLLQEELLVHDACEGDSLEVLQILVNDIGLGYDTWLISEQCKPFHKVALRGKVDMMKFLLDMAANTSDYVNTTAIEDPAIAPLDYAIEGDKLDAVFFLIEHGGEVRNKALELEDDVDFLEELFYCAMSQGSLRVATRLLEISYSLKRIKGGGILDELSHKVLHRFQNHGSTSSSLLDYFGKEYRSDEYVLALMQNHLAESELSGVEPVRLACDSGYGNNAVFRMLISFCSDFGPSFTTLEDKLQRFVGEQGSIEMATYALEKLSGEVLLEHILGAAVEHGNLKLVEFLKEKRPKNNKEQDYNELEAQTDYESDSDNTEVSDGNMLISSLCEAVVHQADTNSIKRKLRKLVICLDSTEISAVEDWEPSESLKGIELLGELELITKNTAVWTSIAPELLNWFAHSGDMEMVEHLLGRGVPVDSPEYTFWITETPLMRAVSGQHLEVAEKILLAGADPNARMRAGYTCMDMALGLGNRKLVRLLIKYGFDTGTKSRDNETYMDLIAKGIKILYINFKNNCIGQSKLRKYTIIIIFIKVCFSVVIRWIYFLFLNIINLNVTILNLNDLTNMFISSCILKNE